VSNCITSECIWPSPQPLPRGRECAGILAYSRLTLQRASCLLWQRHPGEDASAARSVREGQIDGAEGMLMEVVLDNFMEELSRPRTHVDILLQLLEESGISHQEAACTEPAPEHHGRDRDDQRVLPASVGPGGAGHAEFSGGATCPGSCPRFYRRQAT